MLLNVALALTGQLHGCAPNSCLAITTHTVPVSLEKKKKKTAPGVTELFRFTFLFFFFFF